MITADTAAEQILQPLRDEHGALPLPVDPITVARGLGINVWSADLTPDLSGMITKSSPNSDPEVFLNKNHAPVRQRFTCAHEIGHYFENIKTGAEASSVYLHKRDGRSSCGSYTEEIYANRFAACLLMPAQEVQSYAGIGLSAIQLASLFHVSVDAMMVRLGSLRLPVG